MAKKPKRPVVSLSGASQWRTDARKLVKLDETRHTAARLRTGIERRFRFGEKSSATTLAAAKEFAALGSTAAEASKALTNFGRVLRDAMEKQRIEPWWDDE